MNWKHLILEEALETIVEASHQRPQLIFKHSTRCSISSMAKSRLEREWKIDQIDAWYLDLLKYRPISNIVASRFKVRHESPQAILFKDGRVVYHGSHSAVSVNDIAKALT